VRQWRWPVIEFRPETRARWLIPAGHIGYGLLPAVLIPYLLVSLIAGQGFALDFHYWYWPAGNHILHGLSPYTASWPLALNYPAPGALLFVPFALLPHALADAIFTGLCLLAAPATLRVLNVRDWRLYGNVMLWEPVWVGWQTANVSLLLVLGVACAWRWRNRAVVVGLIVALLVSIKLFLWPLGFWLLGTRRYRGLVWSVCVGGLLNILAWATLGFDELPRFISALSTFADHVGRGSYSLTSLALSQGASRTAAYALGLGIGTAAAIAGVILGRRGKDRFAFTACIAAALLASPVVESHYLALLIVPLALARPVASAIWTLPLLLWIVPAGWPSQWQRIVALCVVAGLLAVALRGSMGRSSGRAASNGDRRSLPTDSAIQAGA
jgi:alpha-1,2-mannosyltransferase